MIDGDIHDQDSSGDSCLEPPHAPHQENRETGLARLRIGEIAAVLMLLLVTLGVYRSVAGFSFLNFDDNLYVKENLTVRRGLSFEGVRAAFTGIVAANWHPLTILSHMLDCSFSAWMRDAIIW
jgi:hypothetical protein